MGISSITLKQRGLWLQQPQNKQEYYYKSLLKKLKASVLRRGVVHPPCFQSVVPQQFHSSPQIPISLAGLTVAHRTAVSRGMPKLAAVCMHFIKLVAEPRWYRPPGSLYSPLQLPPDHPENSCCHSLVNRFYLNPPYRCLLDGKIFFVSIFMCRIMLSTK